MQIIFLITGYLIGAVPFGLLLGKIAGKDVRTEGSRNIGATNVNRVLGIKFGLLTLVLDCLKGFLPMYLAFHFLPESDSKELFVALTGVLAMVGHMFPVYLKFRGGKGVATGLGVFLFLSPGAVVLSLLVFLATVGLSGFVSAGSLLASALIPLWLFFSGASKTIVICALLVAFLIWLKHHQNIRRLLAGNEKSWKNKG